MMIELELPWPPSVNHYKSIGSVVVTKNGKTYQKRVNSVQTKRFYYEVWLAIRSGMATKRVEMLCDSTIALEVALTMHPPHNRRYDVDNFIKVTLDSLVRGGLIKDDSLIMRLYVEKCEMISNGKIIVRIKPKNAIKHVAISE